MFRAVTILLCGAVTACVSMPAMEGELVSSEVRDKIAACGAGLSFSQSAEAELAAELAEIEAGQGEISASAGIRQAIAATVFEGVDLDDESAAASFASYTACVEKAM